MSWSYLDIKDFFIRVRDVLGNINETTLPDIKISMPERAPTAERLIKKYVPDWETYKDSIHSEEKEKFAIFESCIVYQTAIFFETYVLTNRPKSMKASNLSAEFFDTSNQKDDLKGILDGLLAELEVTTEDSRMFGFRVT